MSPASPVLVLTICLIYLCNGQEDGGGYQRPKQLPCNGMKCQNGGRCIQKYGSSYCECPEGFEGLFCQNYTCHNGGICKLNYMKRPECTCKENYKGEQCELTPTCPKFTDSNCKGKFCSKDSHCPKGQMCCTSTCGGTRCTVPEYVHANTGCTGLCFNGGQCMQDDHDVHCKCRFGFFGERCQFKNITHSGICPEILVDKNKYCIGQRCDHDGECLINEKCCLASCGQKTCQLNVYDPCSNFCKNGGDCIIFNNLPQCTCRPGFTGAKCESPIAPKPGVCPNPQSFSICLVECSVDDQCPGSQKCCKTTCGGSVCSDTVTVPDIEEPCKTIKCSNDEECRVVFFSNTDQPVVRCVAKDKLPKDPDTPCQRLHYENSLLTIADYDEDSLSLFKCAGPEPIRQCPKKSFCVDDGEGGATCCRGQAPLIDPIKPGYCPPLSQMSSWDAGETVYCQADDDCREEFKCCDSPCGGKTCNKPMNEKESCPEGCQEGESCDYLKVAPLCPSCLPTFQWKCVALNCSMCSDTEQCLDEGEICYEKQLTGAMKLRECQKAFSCSSKPNQCGKCPRGHVCIDSFLKCSTTQCSPFTCVPSDKCNGCPPDQDCIPGPSYKWQCIDRIKDYTLVPEVYCEKCQEDEVCMDTNIRCVKEPCPSFKCVKTSTVPCNLECEKPRTCQIVTPGWTYDPVVPREGQPQAQCVLEYIPV